MQLPSGLWSGYYVQGGLRYPQQSGLEFADGMIRGDGRDDIGMFYVDGEYRVDEGQVRLGWIKTYEGAHSVLYLGTLHALGSEASEIRGIWQLQSLQGDFALTPHRNSMEMSR